MLFNSWQFGVFLPVVLFLYWFVVKRNLRAQNILLLLASIFFYGSWSVKFIPLLAFSITLDYFTGLKIAQAENIKHKRNWLLLSLSANLGLLGFFKYYNFLASNISSIAGYPPDSLALKIILPLGISFYTFHGMSYVIDIYKGRITPTKNYIDYAVFVAYFPLLIAGPIERAAHLLPQIQAPRIFNRTEFETGIKQILWGLFKKMVIADNLAPFVNSVYNNYAHASGGTLMLGVVLFVLQVYADFSGYSDIAIGASRMMGIELFRNFAFPLFSRNMAEFWRRWHISLSTWLRDYVYIPLGGNKGSQWQTTRNIFITFLLCGIWHGANWTFVILGLLNGLYVTFIALFHKNKIDREIVAKGRLLPTPLELFKILGAFTLTCSMMLFFRAENVHQAGGFITGILSRPLFFLSDKPSSFLVALLLSFLTIEWLGREQEFPIAQVLPKLPRYIGWSFYYMLFLSLFFFAAHVEHDFVYFQF